MGFVYFVMTKFADLFMGLAKLFSDLDCALLEINPLVITSEGNVHCLDAKMNVDSNALYRQARLNEMNDPSQEDAREAQTREAANSKFVTRVNACEGGRTRAFFQSTSGAEEEGSKLGRLANSLRLVPRYKQIVQVSFQRTSAVPV